ncbi:MAG: ABC transporter permease, partial [bacterium]|nr:ABC transporter permease [bacterium]
YLEPDRLVQLGRQLPMGRSNAVSINQFLYWRDHQRSFSGMATYEGRGGGVNLVEGDRPERVGSLGVSTSFFSVLGVPPQLGRDFTAEDGAEGAPRVAMISDGLWRKRFGSSREVVGRTIRLSGEEHTVIGVMARGFDFINRADVWTPLTLRFDLESSPAVYYTVVRLRPEVSLDVARTDMQAIGEALRGEYPTMMRDGEEVFARPYLDQVVGNVRPALWILLGAVGLVLLVACANVANLLLARATGRRREMALRASLGANRLDIVRQLLVESLLLALIGGGLGLLAARLGMGLLVTVKPSSLPRLDAVEIDGPVIVFTFTVAVLTGVLFGLVPALQAARVDLGEVLKDGSAGAGARRGWARSALVVSETALALVLVIGAALLLASFAKVTALDPGYDYQKVLTMKMSPGAGGSDDLTTARLSAFVDQVVERLEAKPGIEAAATISTLPLEHGLMTFFDVEGRPRPDATEREGGAQWRLTSPDYFRAMGIPLVAGRAFTAHDDADSPRVIVINQALARRYFPDEDPVGRALVQDADEPPDRIIGVVGDVRELALDRPPTPTVYAAAAQAPDETTAFLANLFPVSWVVRTTGDPLDYGGIVRAEILAVDPEQPVSDLRGLEELMSGSIASRQFSTLLLSIFAALALVLAVVGIYGVMSYAVAQRTREIGIRQALGATGGAALRLILGQGVKLASIGVAVGVLAALASSRWLTSMLYETAPTSPAIYATTSAALLAAVAVACLIPAMRATRVDPIVALRDE